MRILVTKSTGRAKDESCNPIVKEPKNKKHRTIPIPTCLERLYCIEYQKHKANGGLDSDRVFKYAHSYALRRLKDTCKLLDINSAYNCHTFRHTYISNLIKQNVPLPVIEKVSGDTQETILKRYSHMFEHDEVIVLKVLENIK